MLCRTLARVAIPMAHTLRWIFFATATQGKGPQYDDVGGGLFSRALQAWPLAPNDLDDATFAKIGHPFHRDNGLQLRLAKHSFKRFSRQPLHHKSSFLHCPLYTSYGRTSFSVDRLAPRPVLRPCAHRSWYNEGKCAGVEFVGCYPKVEAMPNLDVPEVAFIGRSNVGKSSALNTLTTGIAFVSKKPGRTRTMNLFKVGRIGAVVDLPGYGYAKLPKNMRNAFTTNTQEYMRNRAALRLIVFLVDSRHEPQENDKRFYRFLRSENVTTLVVATKTDKLSAKGLAKNMEQFRNTFGLPGDQPLPLSALTGFGVKPVWQKITEIAATEVSKVEEARANKDMDDDYY